MTGGAEAQRRRSGGAAGVQRFVVEIVMELGRRGRIARLNARGGLGKGGLTMTIQRAVSDSGVRSYPPAIGL